MNDRCYSGGFASASVVSSTVTVRHPTKSPPLAGAKPSSPSWSVLCSAEKRKKKRKRRRKKKKKRKKEKEKEKEKKKKKKKKRKRKKKSKIEKKERKIIFSLLSSSFPLSSLYFLSPISLSRFSLEFLSLRSFYSLFLSLTASWILR